MADLTNVEVMKQLDAMEGKTVRVWGFLGGLVDVELEGELAGADDGLQVVDNNCMHRSTLLTSSSMTGRWVVDPETDLTWLKLLGTDDQWVWIREMPTS